MSEEDKKVIDVNENSDIFMDAQVQAKYAIEHYKTSESRIASHIKYYFDNKYGQNWHCFVGKFINRRKGVQLLRELREQALHVLVRRPGRGSPLQNGLISHINFIFHPFSHYFLQWLF